MNFGNPEKPEIMGQFAAAIQGMGDACRALDFPVVSGNVSLYNETEGTGILPTPAIGGVGVLDDAAVATGIALPEGASLVAIGADGTWLGQSLWLREIAGREEGPPPRVDLSAERAAGDFVRARIGAGQVLACHDVSDGGLLVAVVEMVMASGVGAAIAAAPDGTVPHAYWFGEDQGRYVLAVTDPAATIAAAEAAGIPARHLGEAGGSGLTLGDDEPISVVTLREAHQRFFPEWMRS